MYEYVPQERETSQTSWNTFKTNNLSTHKRPNDIAAPYCFIANNNAILSRTLTCYNAFIFPIDNQKWLKQKLWTILKYGIHCLYGIHITDAQLYQFPFFVNRFVFLHFTQYVVVPTTAKKTTQSMLQVRKQLLNPIIIPIRNTQQEEVHKQGCCTNTITAVSAQQPQRIALAKRQWKNYDA